MIRRERDFLIDIHSIKINDIENRLNYLEKAVELLLQEAKLNPIEWEYNYEYKLVRDIKKD